MESQIMSQHTPGTPVSGFPVVARPRGNALALTGMIVGVVALLLCLIPIVNGFALLLGLLALIFGIIGLVKTRDGRPGKSMAIAAIILSVLAGIGFGVSTAITVAAVDAMDQAVNEAADDLDEDLGRIDGSGTDDILATDLTVDLGKFEVTEDEYGLVETRLPVTVTNNADEKFTYDIQVEAVDKSGKRIADDLLITSALGAGQSQDLDLFSFVEEDKIDALKTAKFQIVEVSQF
jgi:hypothetical protein